MFKQSCVLVFLSTPGLARCASVRARQAGQGGGVGGRHLQHAGGGRGREEDQAAARPRARQDGVLHPHGGEGRIQGAVSHHLNSAFDDVL